MKCNIALEYTVQNCIIRISFIHDYTRRSQSLIKVDDVIGCLLDFDEGCISFSVNGELMIDNQGQELAFNEIGIVSKFFTLIDFFILLQ